MKELMIKKFETPVVPEFNYEEIKTAVDEIVNQYSNIAYTEDDIKDAKKDRAEINKLKTALDNKRKEVKKAFTEPLQIFETQIKELVKALDSTASLIDSKVAEVEARQKLEKREKIEEFIELAYKDLDCKPIFDERWLNKGTSMKSIKEEILAGAEKLKSDIASLNASFANSQFLFEGLTVLRDTKDLSKAISEISRLETREEQKQQYLKEKEEYEKAVQQPVKEQPAPAAAPDLAPCTAEPTAILSKGWVTLQVQASKVELSTIKAFLEANNISYIC